LPHGISFLNLYSARRAKYRARKKPRELSRRNAGRPRPPSRRDAARPPPLLGVFLFESCSVCTLWGSLSITNLLDSFQSDKNHISDYTTTTTLDSFFSREKLNTSLAQQLHGNFVTPPNDLRMTTATALKREQRLTTDCILLEWPFKAVDPPSRRIC